MRGIAPPEFGRRSGSDVRRRRRSRADVGTQRFRVGLRGQAIDRDLHKVGVTHEHGAIGIGALHSLDHVVQQFLAAKPGEIVTFKDIQHFDQVDAAR